MEIENKIKCVLIDFEQGEITLSEATNTILRLFDVSRCNSDKLVECSNCGDKVEMISSGEFCPHCFC
jgi:hypothetical protein